MLVLDFSEKEIVWEYEKFPCDKCEKQFETKRSLKMHILKHHKDNTILEKKKVLFQEGEEVQFNEDTRTKHCNMFRTEALQDHIQSSHIREHNKSISKLKV